MSVPGILAAFVLVSAVLFIVAYPYFRRDTTVDNALAEKQRERLTVYYDRALRNLRDLDEDNALGKIDPDAYAEGREAWSQRGMAALKAIDALDSQADAQATTAASLIDTPILVRTAPEESAIDRAIDDAIETAIRRQRAALGEGG